MKNRKFLKYKFKHLQKFQYVLLDIREKNYVLHGDTDIQSWWFW